MHHFPGSNVPDSVEEIPRGIKISYIYIYWHVLLAWYALRGEALRPPPCTPPPAFIFLTAPFVTYSHSWVPAPPPAFIFLTAPFAT